MWSLKFIDFLMIMVCILIILLIIQGLDYIVGFGVNNYMFVLFCVCFSFTLGSVYHHILRTRELD